MRRFFECLIPTTACNLRCSYCYLIQENRRKGEPAIFRYSPEIIGKGLSQKRLGGVSLISMTASGETFLPPELPSIAREILKQGHYINITTNGTLTKQIQKLLQYTESYHSHIHMSFSFHYIELKERGLLDTFFENIKMVKAAGCSILLQINLVDEYVPYWEEIKTLSIRHTGALPQVALTRDETSGTYKILSGMTREQYESIGNEMKSPLFNCTCENFMVKRHEYCYAGLWSAKLNLGTGIMSACYGHGMVQNIFEDINKPIIFEPIGKNCPFQYCFNSSHFISQGIIPELRDIPSYGELRNREEAEWYTNDMKTFLYQKFEDTNPLLSNLRKSFYSLRKSYWNVKHKAKQVISNISDK